MAKLTPTEIDTVSYIDKLDSFRAREILKVLYNAVLDAVESKRASLASPDDFVRLKTLIERNILP